MQNNVGGQWAGIEKLPNPLEAIDLKLKAMAPIIAAKFSAGDPAVQRWKSPDELIASIRAAAITHVLDAMTAELRNFADEKARNGISQHDPEWKRVRANLYGGSSMGTIEGVNPYQTPHDLIATRLGLSRFTPNHACMFGNLFEEIIQRFCEYDMNVQIVGESIFTFGPPPTCYSPDGISAIYLTEYTRKEHVVLDDDDCETITITKTATMRITPILWEFKCPYGRIPDGNIPRYYRGQPQLGMALLDLPAAIFAEAVYRRCSWAALGANSEFTPTPTRRISGDGMPLSYGFIGFTTRPIEQIITNITVDTPTDPAKHPEAVPPHSYTAAEIMAVRDKLLACVVCAVNSIYDFGICPRDIFETALVATDMKILVPHYMPMIHVNPPTNPIGNGPKGNYFEDSAEAMAYMDMILEKFEADNPRDFTVGSVDRDDSQGIDSQWKNFRGILPWKLFSIDYHNVSPEPNFLDKRIAIMNAIDSHIEYVKTLDHKQWRDAIKEYKL